MLVLLLLLLLVGGGAPVPGAWRVKRAALNGVITDEQQTPVYMQAVCGVPYVAFADMVHPGSWCCATTAV